MDSCRELIVVTTSEWNPSEATLHRYVRANIRVPWKAAGQPITVMLGKNGLGWGTGVLTPPAQDAHDLSKNDPLKKEGDGKAPAGVFRLSKAFGYAPQEQSGWKMPYVSLTPTIECVDEEKSKFYNTLVDTSAVSADWGSHENEKMRRADDLYRWGILVDHNANPPVAGGGSCIFMHIWRGPGQPTVGCTAMAQADLESLLGWLDPAAGATAVGQVPEIASSLEPARDKRSGGSGRHYNAEWTKIGWQRLTRDSWRLPPRWSMEKGLTCCAS